MNSYSLSIFLFQELGYDFYGNMQLFDPEDRDAIKWGLKRVFDHSPPEINEAIACQVLFNLM